MVGSIDERAVRSAAGCWTPWFNSASLTRLPGTVVDAVAAYLPEFEPGDSERVSAAKTASPLRRNRFSERCGAGRR